MLLMEAAICRTLVLLDIVPGNPEARDAAPEGPGELGQRVDEAVVDDLGDDIPRKVRHAGEEEILETEQSHLVERAD